MSISESRLDQVVVFAIEGKLDAALGPELEEHVGRALEAGLRHVVLDGGRLTYVSSGGLRALLSSARRAAAAGGALGIAGLAPGPKDVIDLTGIGSVIGVHPTVDAAAAALTARSPGMPPATGVHPAERDAASGLTLMEEVALLSIDGTRGTLRPPRNVLHLALAGAALADLVLLNRMDAEVDHVVILDTTPSGHDVLDDALRELTAIEPPRSVAAALAGLARKGESFLARTLDRLVAHGVLRREGHRLLRALGLARYRTVDGRQCQEVTARLTDLVLTDEVPELRDAVLMGLVESAGLTAVALTDPAAAKRRERIQALASLDRVGAEVAQSVARVLDPLAAASSHLRGL